MKELIKWSIILLFGCLFVGCEFVLFLTVAFVVMVGCKVHLLIFLAKKSLFGRGEQVIDI